MTINQNDFLLGLMFYTLAVYAVGLFRGMQLQKDVQDGKNRN